MSKFYATIKSDKGSNTRAGHRWVKATAQSWEGSAQVAIEEDGNGVKWLTVCVGERSRTEFTESEVVLRGKLLDVISKKVGA